MKLNHGILIAVEGIDGSGKSTLAHNITAALHAHDLPVILTKEPGGTKLGLELRTILQTQLNPLTPKAEFLLFAADRAQHFHEIVIPSLQQNKIVISDRMADSSLVYQGYGRGLNKAILNNINTWAMNDISPDITFYVHVNYEIARKRIEQRKALTAFEKEHKEFIHKLIAGFDTINNNNTNGIRLDGSHSEKELTDQAVEVIKKWIQKHNT